MALYQTSREDSEEDKQATEALREIGTNALPYLIKWIAETESRQPYLGSADAFGVLGTNAAPAVPELALLLASTNRLAATLAGTALGHIGKPALPALIAAYTNGRFRVGTEAALALVELGTNARPAIPLLLRDLNHPNHFYRERAADTLGKLQMEPEIVVPALTRLLGDDSSAARFITLLRLGDFGPQARSALPAISNFLTHAEEEVRKMATNVIRKIALEGLDQPVSR